MGRLEDMTLFVRIVEAGSFTAAARKLGWSKSLASRRIAELEARLGARLFNRTTRRLGTTEIGRNFYERAVRILAEVEEAEAGAMEANVEPRGRLKVAAPMSFGQLHLGPAIARFLKEHPQIELELDLNDRHVDMVGEGFDLAIRIGRLPDSSLVGRTLAPCRMLLCGSPAYIAASGAPRVPSDLAQHDCLVYSNRLPSDEFRFQVRGKWVSPPIRHRLAANNGDMLCRAAIEGLGLVAAPSFIVSGAIAAGQLVPVMCDYPLPESDIRAVYPAGRQVPARLRRLVDFLAGCFGRQPYWDANLPGLAA